MSAKEIQSSKALKTVKELEEKEPDAGYMTNRQVHRYEEDKEFEVIKERFKKAMYDPSQLGI